LSSASNSIRRSTSLLAWYQYAARPLPWRDTKEPYRIWISEIMLQQTQVKTVLPRYQTWFHIFPDIATLAAASLDNVLKAWEGLGYYRRARFIHQAAKQIIARHGGQFPQNFDSILALPGIGRSTAGAIAAFCFSAHTPVLDGNVKRVLRRWHQKPQATEHELWMFAQQALDVSNQPADWNQAMMELGATLCSAKKPECGDCPVSNNCDSAFNVDSATKAKPKSRIRDVYWQVHLHVDAEKGIWLTQRPDSGIWAGLWTPPITELAAAPEQKPCHVHLLTHRRLHLYAKKSDIPLNDSGQWVADISEFALPTGIHRLLEKQQVQNSF